RDDNQAVEETGLGDVGDAAVNNDAGVEDFVAFLARLFAAENPAERRQIEQVAFVRSHGQSLVGHDHHDHDLQEALGGARRDAVANDEREKISANDAEHAADGGPDQALQAHRAQSPLENDDGHTDRQAEGGIQA